MIHLQAILILAGGQSRRMGADKALLTLPSKQTLLEHHIDGAITLADKLGVPILIADNQKNFLAKIKPINSKIPIISIDDYQAGQGALSAIAGAMLASDKPNKKLSEKLNTKQKFEPQTDNAYLLVLSCDAMVTANEIWQTLYTYLQTLQTKPLLNQPHIFCFADSEHSYPLLGLYPYALKQALLDYLHTGSQRVMSFIKPYQITIDLPKDWQGLVNINTPEQFIQACQLLNSNILFISKENHVN
ncbi:molybdenum cofactor guanylyltransferase [Psychrobacter sp. I-STPA6b]|uniref:molybdenum cofactor guanylyltransferase n=1 Tax=Psychrobacter sp. I-STPA6b TaxID=2585718 RepID=UPI001D0C9347|nr:molybdenum cofactor guanylyltransferase [Psychrobacter sp. I-STPA6b]